MIRKKQWKYGRPTFHHSILDGHEATDVGIAIQKEAEVGSHHFFPVLKSLVHPAARIGLWRNRVADKVPKRGFARLSTCHKVRAVIRNFFRGDRLKIRSSFESFSEIGAVGIPCLRQNLRVSIPVTVADQFFTDYTYR